MRDKDKEEQAEWRRLEEERAAKESIHRMYQELPLTAAGDRNMQENRRTGRLLQMSFRMQPKTRQLVRAIMRLPHRPPSLVVLFEQMLEAYLRQHGGLDDRDVPSDDESINMFLKERDKRDGE